MRLTAASLCVAATVAVTWTAPRFGADATQQQPFKTNTTAVVVDVVVRDKHGAPILGLQREDFELLEDGVSQDIADFRAPSRGDGTAPPLAAATSASAPGRAEPSPSETSSLVALVFGRLSPEGRGLAQRAAEASLIARSGPHDLIGVFGIDLALTMFQDFTFDDATLRQAVTRAVTRATSGPPGTPGTETTPNAEYRSAFLPGISQLGNASDLEGLGLESEFEARATLAELTRLASAMGRLPDRKTIIYFAESMTIYPEMEPYFQGLIDTANRGNVSIYTMDAAGLRTHSQNREFATMLNSMTGSAPDPRSGTGMLDGRTVATLLRSGDTPSILTLLARETGGFSITQTNDLAGHVRNITEDRQSYYLLTYTPKNTDFRGEHRRIQVRVKRRDVVVRARPGYLAVRDPGPVVWAMPFEQAAFSALSRSPAPHDIPIRMGAFIFPLPDGKIVVPLVVETSARDVKFQETTTGYRAEGTILAVIRNSTGDMVRTGSLPYRLTGPAGQLETARTGNIVFFRQPELAPGRYTVEAAISDALGERAGVARTTLEVPALDAHALRVSSLVIVGRVERIASPAHDAQHSPLLLGHELLVPSVPKPISRRETPKITYFLSIVPKAGPGLRASLELLQDEQPGEQTVGQVELTLAKPDALGRIQQAGVLPAGQLSPGNYRARVTVTQGSTRSVREVSFSIID